MTTFQIPSSPIAALGTLTLMLAFLVIAYAGAAGLVGQKTNRPGLVASSLWASWAFTALMCFASCLIIFAFLSHDFRIKYVAHYSDTTMPLFYQLTAYWGGLDGSLMFWVWVLSMFSGVALFANRHRHRDMIGYMVATIAAVALFFLALLLYSKNPFTTFLSAPPVEGKGLNPLLQNYWMVIHPPSLYTGYVGMTIPFAFCMAALASGRLDDSWLYSVRIWVLIPWFFLSFGLILGGLWAYEELGWGGYWAWDPVENAGLIPWFTATAFLHSAIIQEQRGMMKRWNMLLVIVTFFLTIFGTFMTRAGIVQSVHAFGQDNQLALLFLIFMVVMITVSTALLLYRLPALSSVTTFDSFLSREFAFLLNNVVLLICAFFVLFATMFPTISEYVLRERITVREPFFNRFMIPIALVLLLLTGVGPLLAWRKTSGKRLLEQFIFPVAVSAVTMGLLAWLWPPSRAMVSILSESIHAPIPMISFGLVSFVLASILQEFARGTKVRKQQTGTDVLTALVGVVFTKRRKYGGYIVHAGIAIMFFGFVGKAYQRDKSVTVQGAGETWTMEGYTFRYDDLVTTSNDNRDMYTAHITLTRGTEKIAELYAGALALQDRHRGDHDRGATSIAGCSRTSTLVMNGFDPQTKQANFTIYLNPFVNFVWTGFGFLAVGTMVCLFPLFLWKLLDRGKSGGAAVVTLLVFSLALALGGGVARADTTTMPADPGVHVIVQNGPGVVEDEAGAPPVAHRLWADLACMCGGCNKEALGECRCGNARAERERILGMLAGKDLSTPAKEEAAYREVVAAYIARFGGNTVLRVPPNRGFNLLAWAVPYASFAGGLVLVVLIARGWVARGRASTAAATASMATAALNKPKAAAAAAGNSKYEDLLDEELDDLD